jgi:hypothetical protein
MRKITRPLLWFALPYWHISEKKWSVHLNAGERHIEARESSLK